MLAMAVSLANEGLNHDAFTELKKWQMTFCNKEAEKTKNYFEESYGDFERVFFNDSKHLLN